VIGGGVMTRSNTRVIDVAKASDVPAVMDLLLSRATWLRSKGSDQWANFADKQDKLEHLVSTGRTWIMRDDATARPLGTITYVDPDPDFWTPEDRQVPAKYLAKLATDPESAGQGLGRLLLDFAKYQAVADGETREIRFDVWKTAADLQQYYLDQGWTYLRTVEKAGRFSGALFSYAVVPPQVNVLPNGLIIGQPSACLHTPPENAFEPGEREHGGAGVA
jgi:GNAT superfamily N-acetyltransferase